MHSDLTGFWERFHSGIDVAVGSADAEKLLGVRDGFRRYFHDGMRREVPIAVSSEPEAEQGQPLPLTDEEILELAHDRVLELRARLGRGYSFFACSESGLHSHELDGRVLSFVRTWTVVAGPQGLASGGSGSLQLPARLIDGLDADQIPYAIPGKRRRGGMSASLTGGLETHRHSVAQSTLLAISSLFYGVVESRPVRRPAL